MNVFTGIFQVAKKHSEQNSRILLFAPQFLKTERAKKSPSPIVLRIFQYFAPF